MLRLVVLVLSVIVSSQIYAGKGSVVDELKSQNVSMFDLGIARANLVLMLMGRDYKGEHIGDTKFDYSSINLIGDKKGIRLDIEGLGKSKYIGKKQCLAAKSVIENEQRLMKILKLAWPSMTNDKYMELLKTISIRVKLIAKENNDFTKEC
ncbi:hypothetical protein [Candidatus Endoriftia persephonae]|jgi:hypothetical protein|uniref:Uncharacterized protein n=1 Tax=Candidatus Endoriftia persephonae TaxID=393765 RepID=A0A9J6ZUK7_9GAMM|nr:hypothetical protein [Candidatus Endoriftia persephone]USF86394.1 hypothetical protein L0Y14_09575 [Candidatus Endoriftia persephone]